MLATSASGLSLALWGLAPPAFADDQKDKSDVETVIITASKRPQDVQDVPMSVTAFSGDQLERANITDAADLARMVPSLGITTSNTSRNSAIAIRNIGSSGTNPGIEPSVGVFLDGVYMPSSMGIFTELADISTVEVLRGPQGTLYGRNTPVGAINVTSRAPSQDFGAMIVVGLGNYDKRRVAGYVNGGLTENLSGRLSFWSNSRSGYIDNLYTGTDVNSQEQYGLRGRLRWTPDELTTVDGIAYYSKTMSHCCVATQIDPFGPAGIATPGYLAAQAAINPGHPLVETGKFEVNSAGQPTGNTPMWGASVQATRKLPSNMEITNILSYNSLIDKIERLAGPSVPVEVRSDVQKNIYRVVSDELRLSSTGKNFVDYVAGLYFFHDDLRFLQNATFLKGANRVIAATGPFAAGDNANIFFTQDTDSAAIFGQATMNLTDAFRLTGGLRYSHDRKTADITNTTTNVFTGGAASLSFTRNAFPPTSLLGLERSDNSTTWSAGIQYDITPAVMAYVTAGTGFKDGGYNARAASSPPYDFGPEQSETYEAGVKSKLFDDKLLFNADVFRMTLDGFQLSTLNTMTGSGFIVGNAGDALIKGLEIDLQARPLDSLSITGNLSWTQSEYSDYPNGPCVTNYTPTAPSPPPNAPQVNPAKSGTCDYTGYALPFAPRLSGGLHARYEQPAGNTGFKWSVAGGFSYTDDQYLDASLDPRSFQKAYTLFDATVSFESEDRAWRLDFWGRNLANEAYFTNASSQLSGAYISAGGTAQAGGFVGWYGAPRTYGVELTHTF